MKSTKTLYAVGLMFLLGITNAFSQDPRTLLEIQNDLVAEKQPALDAAVAALAADPENEELIAAEAQARRSFNWETGHMTKALGEGWQEIWENSTLPDPDDELIALYKAEPFKLSGGSWSKVSNKGQVELSNWIAEKETLDQFDLWTVRQIKFSQALVDRMDDFAELLPSGTIKGEAYFEILTKALMKRSGIFPAILTTPEWFTLMQANAPMQASTFIAGREYLLMKATKSLMDARTAAEQPIEGAEFDAALQPIIDAFSAPKFTGLEAALTEAGIDIGLPDPFDTSNQQTLSDAIKVAAVNKSIFVTPWNASISYESALGTVMFVLGEDEYTTWRTNVLDAE